MATDTHLMAAEDFGGDVEQATPPFYTVAIFLVDRAYGGPEEGGWWYDTGTRVDSTDEHGQTDVPKIFQDQDAADAFARHVNEALDAPPLGANTKRRSDIGSVLSQGRYQAQVCGGYPKPYWPDQRPHYE